MTAKPPTLRQGDTIGIVLPASAPSEMDVFLAGVETLRSRGYRVEMLRTTFGNHPYLAGEDDDRLDELNGFLRRPDVGFVMAGRGGYGSLRILDRVDYAAASANPTLLVGFSDLTALQLALYTRSQLPSLSGPMVAFDCADPDPRSERLFWSALQGPFPLEIKGPSDEPLTAIRPGHTEGVLIGGNLTLITKLIGTPYLPEMDGAILFIEDVDEKPYRIDGLFAQLKLSGILSRISGLIVGSFAAANTGDTLPEIDEIVSYYAKQLSCPVAGGLVYGHFNPRCTVPVGVRAQLHVTGENAALIVLESPVA